MKKAEEKERDNFIVPFLFSLQTSLNPNSNSDFC